VVREISAAGGGHGRLQVTGVDLLLVTVGLCLRRGGGPCQLPVMFWVELVSQRVPLLRWCRRRSAILAVEGPGFLHIELFRSEGP
jgi:hypothetical protein